MYRITFAHLTEAGLVFELFIDVAAEDHVVDADGSHVFLNAGGEEEVRYRDSLIFSVDRL